MATYQTDDGEWTIGEDMTRSGIYKNEQREKPTATVMRMGTLHLSGNVIPHTWRDHLRRKNERALAKTVVDLEATVALAWIAFWYRPAKILDEKTSTVLGWKKKFWGDKLQASYEHIANETGLSKRQVKEALDRLEAKRPEKPEDPDGYAVITREFRHSRAGSNVLYIDINMDRFIEISFPEDTVDTILRNCGGSSYAIAGDDVSQLRNTYTEVTVTEETNREETTPPASQAQPNMLQDELAALNGATTTHSPGTEKKKRNPRSKVTPVSPGVMSSSDVAPVSGSSHKEMFAALAALCVLDPNVKRVRGQLNATSKQLRDAGYTVADLDKYKAWWKSQDWRGQRGDKPILSLIPTQILQAVQWSPQPAHPQPVQAAKPKGPSLETLRSWHKQHCSEEWKSHIAAELGINPFTHGAFGEWYDSQASIPDDELAAWYEQYLAASKENHQW